MSEYLVPFADVESEFVEKRSRFISHLWRVESEAEARARIEEMKKKYYDARHNCPAFIIGRNRELTRCSDDGEPSGTAGKPILEVLMGAGVTNVAVVVTRYFGGTLLGTGGLVHAYGGAAREGLLAAGVIERRLCNIITVTVDYTTSGRVSHFLAESGHITEDTVYDSEVTYFVCVTKNEKWYNISTHHKS